MATGEQEEGVTLIDTSEALMKPSTEDDLPMDAPVPTLPTTTSTTADAPLVDDSDSHTVTLEFHPSFDAEANFVQGNITTEAQAGRGAANGDEPFGEESQDTQGLLREKEETSVPFWSVNFYRPYFDVDTADVGRRLLHSLFFFSNRFTHTIHGKPDLYGPLWIATTLIFSIAVSANIASFASAKDKLEWHYDFTHLTAASVVVYTYASAVPLCVWAAFKYFELPVSFVHIVCVYGYSFSVFVPTAVLCVIPSEGFRWAVVSLAFVVSCGCVGSNLWDAMTLERADRFTFWGVLVLCHGILALTFKLYFFEY